MGNDWKLANLPTTWKHFNWQKISKNSRLWPGSVPDDLPAIAWRSLGNLLAITYQSPSDSKPNCLSLCVVSTSASNCSSGLSGTVYRPFGVVIRSHFIPSSSWVISVWLPFSHSSALLWQTSNLESQFSIENQLKMIWSGIRFDSKNWFEIQTLTKLRVWR